MLTIREIMEAADIGLISLDQALEYCNGVGTPMSASTASNTRKEVLDALVEEVAKNLIARHSTATSGAAGIATGSGPYTITVPPGSGNYSYTIPSAGFSATPISASTGVNMSASNSADDTTKKLYDFFWGEQEPELPAGSKDPTNCQHDFVDVVLFHTPQLRCRFCDIKKSSVEGAK